LLRNKKKSAVRFIKIKEFFIFFFDNKNSVRII